MNKWFVVYCKPNGDSRAEQNLVSQHYSVYRPIIKKLDKNSGNVRSESLFPRYLFIKTTDPDQALSPVQSTYGVSCFVKFGDQYATVSENLIESLRLAEKERSENEDFNEKYKSGDKVIVNGCGFDNIRAVYCNPCGKERVMIMLNVLGKLSQASVPVSILSRQ